MPLSFAALPKRLKASPPAVRLFSWYCWKYGRLNAVADSHIHHGYPGIQHSEKAISLAP